MRVNHLLIETKTLNFGEIIGCKFRINGVYWDAYYGFIWVVNHLVKNQSSFSTVYPHFILHRFKSPIQIIIYISFENNIQFSTFIHFFGFFLQFRIILLSGVSFQTHLLTVYSIQGNGEVAESENSGQNSPIKHPYIDALFLKLFLSPKIIFFLSQKTPLKRPP